MADQVDAVITPYVAASIIEHGKRRYVAAGFVFGNRTPKEIVITDFVPMTHTGALSDTKSKTYEEERTRRTLNKRAFTADTCIGWYSAGSTSDAAFKQWCSEPGLFMLKGNKAAIHVHCGLPSAENASGSLAINWSAALAREVNGAIVEAPMKLSIAPGAESRVTKVVVNYAQSEVLYGGGQPYRSHPLLDLDTVAFLARKAAIEPQAGSAAADAGEHGTRKNPASAVNGALMDAQKSLRAAVERAQGDTSTPDSKEMLEAIKILHEVRSNTQDRQQANVASREDYATEKFKNALMIKCMAAQLRLQTKQILELASKYPPKKVEE